MRVQRAFGALAVHASSVNDGRVGVRFCPLLHSLLSRPMSSVRPPVMREVAAAPPAAKSKTRLRHKLTRPSHGAVVSLYSSLALALLVVGRHCAHPVRAALVGAIAMSFVEYALHRWGFHVLGTALGPRAYDFIHGAHHRKPWDVSRLPVPLTHSLLVTAGLFALTLPFGIAGAFALGAGLFWYVLYELAHRIAHTRGKLPRVLEHWRRYHAQHHFADQESAYGVSTPLWDLVFRTTPKRRP